MAGPGDGEMNRKAWKWLLPIAMLIFAFFCNIYNVHQYRIQARRDRAVNNVEYLWQHYPAPAERISQALNFPALILDYPLRNEGDAIYERNSSYTLIWIAPREIGFFVAVFLFWHGAGRMLDWRYERNRAIGSRALRIAGLVAGLLFGICTGVYAEQMISLKWLPMREIGFCGCAWAIVLFAYFAWRLFVEFVPYPKATKVP